MILKASYFNLKKQFTQVINIRNPRSLAVANHVKRKNSEFYYQISSFKSPMHSYFYFILERQRLTHHEYLYLPQPGSKLTTFRLMDHDDTARPKTCRKVILKSLPKHQYVV